MPNPPPSKVYVLLATYNGAPYVKAQLDSLLAQTRKVDQVIVRDDGSNDPTAEVLQDYHRTYPGWINVEYGDNLGFVGNFMHLIRHAPLDGEFYFFCDQDDIWLPQKIERALNLLEATDTPKLYFSRLTYTNEHLTATGMSPNVTRTGLGNVLFENLATGCTIAFNLPLLKKLQQGNPDHRHIIAHDWWTYLVAAALGEVVFDPEPTILYRQHAANSLGAEKGFIAELKSRYQNYAKGTWHKRRPQIMIRELLKIYGRDIPPERLDLIQTAIFAQKGRFYPFFLYIKGKIWRQSTLNKAIMLVLLAKDALLNQTMLD